MKNIVFTSLITLNLLALSGCEPTEAALVDEQMPVGQHNTQKQSPKHTIRITQTHKTNPMTRRAQARETLQTQAKFHTPNTIKTQTQKSVPIQHAQMQPRQHVQFKPQPVTRALAPRTPFRVKRCMNLGNALEAPREGEWGYTIRAKDFRIIANARFDTVRIPIRWSKHASTRPPYTIDPSFMRRVQTLVGQAQQNGLGVIIDVHHYRKLMDNPAGHEARLLSFWKQISLAFANAPENVYFELLNEPMGSIDTNHMNALYAKLVPIIRQHNPTRKIIIGGEPWNHLETMETVKWPRDNNLVATFHYYGPHKFTHQGAEWENPVQPVGVQWGSQADFQEMQKSFARARAFAKASGLPIFVGEFGVIDKVPLAQRNQWVKAHRQALEASGFSWCAWDFVGAFKTYDLQKETWLPGSLNALMGR
ncbi:MAG: hypothetical protein COA43_07910 [Robiginitomaculum sp.]|nr:MAG: hypothetical protein COA43_07910 [Robiginitomaculum sp.]